MRLSLITAIILAAAIAAFLYFGRRSDSHDAIDILGCTDLPVLHHNYPIKTTFPIYDSIKIASKKLRGLL